MFKIEDEKQQEKSPDRVDIIKKFGRILVKAVGVAVFLASIILIINAWVYAFTYDEPIIISAMVETSILSVFAVLGLLPFMMPMIRARRARANKEKQ